jgi:hypothetical protein
VTFCLDVACTLRCTPRPNPNGAPLTYRALVFPHAIKHRYGKGVPRRIDCCYPDDWLALEALGFEFHGLRARWDDDALRGNDLQLAGFRVLHFTSAFTDRQIAEQVAEALGRRCEAAPGPDVTFSEWSASR